MHKYNRAFTLVELLIVIVVIAILAAISIVAYNGIQERAYISKIAATVDSYVKAVHMYHAVHDQYPSTGNASGRACLSTSGSLPAGNGFGADGCTSGDVDTVIDSQLNAQLSESVTSLPEAAFSPVDIGNGNLVRGIVYWPNADGAFIEYYIDGNYDCPSGRQMDFSNGSKSCTVIVGSPWGGTS